MPTFSARLSEPLENLFGSLAGPWTQIAENIGGRPVDRRLRDDTYFDDKLADPRAYGMARISFQLVHGLVKGARHSTPYGVRAVCAWKEFTA